ncbi:MAG: methyltransferase domain-containing protein [Magnetococcales bacterium]|nr:methyltransferase domain-containing protein [Magnetococcales bacterium]
MTAPVHASHPNREQRMARLRPLLACPHCGGRLEFSQEMVHCKACAADYPIRNGQIRFVGDLEADDPLDSLKARLKRRLGSWYYRVGITLFAPTYPFNYRKAVCQLLDPKQQVVVDIGCGNHRIDPDIVTLDLFPYEHVDLVCDLTRLPFRPDSVDAFVSRSALEHVPKLKQVVEQLKLSTCPGGLGIHLIPFLYPFHASPHDYQRLTHIGAAELFEPWEVVEQRNATGPVTLLLLVLIEFLSVILSFGSSRLRAYLGLVLPVLLFPIKFLDAPFVGRRAFLGMAPSILTTVRKP